ncbi:conserved crenarchaeal protein [Hyperthermus butylicus DSM 5456]|uniref:Conserved crenarchaeal protein n=1 Tax=Hyperthermus butylicus (strain DSM 5456 / JCM 9403 / PLM1-5) TaxID=415426 RepID=A2BMB1_HYPBU|nr:conserved crenarchaeal protein [Hyperthermus butylicus DSM 5456]
MIVLGRKVDYNAATRLLESKLIMYQVELERNPANTRAKRMLELLEAIRSEINKYRDPVNLQLVFLVCKSHSGAEIAAVLKPLKSMLQPYRCKISLTSISLGGNFPRRGGTVLSGSKALRELGRVALPLSILEFARESQLSIPIGVDLLAGGFPIFLPIHDEYGARHTLVVGPSGRGKTYLLGRIVALVLALLPHRVVVVDPKGDLAGLIDSFCGCSEVVEVIDDSDEEYLSRIVHDKVRELLERSRYAVLVVDEAWRLAGSHALNVALREGRSRGLAVIMASQQPGDFTTTHWANTSNVIVFGSKDRSYISLVARYSGIEPRSLEHLTHLDIGEALIRYSNTSIAIPFRVLEPPLITVKRPP